MKPGFPYAETARMCAMDFADRGQCLAILAILVLVKLEPWFGKVNPLKIDRDHFLLILCLGADVLEAQRRNVPSQGTFR